MPPSRTEHKPMVFKCSKCLMAFKAGGLRDMHPRQHNPITIASASGRKHILQWKNDKADTGDDNITSLSEETWTSAQDQIQPKDCQGGESLSAVRGFLPHVRGCASALV
ncbi:hypothetical protein BX661DRAFT_173220 [Kickxella alabastrina]|uniref:uncharacterized protein n=1 Tax=Kickxella alabastrina TaxID=61397 RepID=UPI00221E5758|nr:uncharacterized protein BX661DRAFT_173220 [Kickxella alabastrina]KAI7821817.1 hypothetical protein BX661DRAFT_173220 [Kickxella alabastrina]